jgi:hypothetical protein
MRCTCKIVSALGIETLIDRLYIICTGGEILHLKLPVIPVGCLLGAAVVIWRRRNRGSGISAIPLHVMKQSTVWQIRMEKTILRDGAGLETRGLVFRKEVPSCNQRGWTSVPE